MGAIESDLLNYLNELGLGPVELSPLEQARDKLPVFLGKAYDFRALPLFNKTFVLLLRRGAGEPTPAEALKHVALVRDRLGQAVIIVLADLKSFNRRRWVENGLSFIVPGKHFHCPMHLVDFRESARHAAPGVDGDRGALSAASQALLLAYLQHSPPCSILADWADYLHYTRMTVSRARRELEAAQLCEARRVGRSMTLLFSKDRKSLWERALPLLRSPVLRKKEIEIVPQADLGLLRAGMSALSDLSLLSDDPVPTYAMSSVAFKAAFEAGRITEATGGGPDGALVELWSYAPAVLGGEAGQVDRLSLYLSLRDNPDERVQGALREMMEKMPW